MTAASAVCTSRSAWRAGSRSASPAVAVAARSASPIEQGHPELGLERTDGLGQGGL